MHHELSVKLVYGFVQHRKYQYRCKPAPRCVREVPVYKANPALMFIKTEKYQYGYISLWYKHAAKMLFYNQMIRLVKAQSIKGYLCLHKKKLNPGMIYLAKRIELQKKEKQTMENA